MSATTTAEPARWHRRTDPLVSQLAGGVAVAIGAVIGLLLAAATPSRDITLLLGVTAAGAAGFGVLLIKAPELLPVPLLDTLLVVTDLALVLLSWVIDPKNDPLTNAFPGIYLLIGMIIFAVRGPWTIVGHTAMLGASYAGVLALGPEVEGEATRWALWMTVTVASGLLIHWLTSTLSGLADAEHHSRALAEAATDDLRRVNEAKNVFLSQMSHELRTPLNAMQGFADLLVDGHAGPLNDVQKEYAGHVSESTRHLVDLVEDVLDITVIESGDTRLVIEDLCLKTALQESVRLVIDNAARRQQTITVDLSSDLGRVAADPIRLRQILVNLLANAIKFTPPGGRIDVRATPSNDRVRISVIDTGIGIEPRDQDRIFDAYARTSPDVEGTGLGLPLARRLVELHGGLLTVKSAPGEGSEFAFDLPRTHAQWLASGEIQPDDVHVSRSAAFTEPGSAPNRALLASIANRLFIMSAVFGVIVALITPLTAEQRIGLIAISVLAIGVGMVFEVRPIVFPLWAVEVWSWGSVLIITVVAHEATRFTHMIPLANVWLIIVVFALWFRGRAILHFAWIAGLSAVLLLRDFSSMEQTTYAAVLTPLAFTALEVNWLVGRVRSLVESEQAAHMLAMVTQRELAAASRHKSAFVANMSHELRTPLNSIIGFSDLLRSEVSGPLTETQRDYLCDVGDSARQLLSIINDVLDVATLEADRMQLHRRLVDVADLIDAAVDAAGERPDPTTSIDITVGAGAESLEGDADRLTQALGALIANAFAFTRTGEIVRIVASAPEPGSVAIEVSDTGVGINAEELATIFEPFRQGASRPVNERRRGTGLGLSLARSLVELHGGAVTVDSEPGRGSTFLVTLPAPSAEPVRARR